MLNVESIDTVLASLFVLTNQGGCDYLACLSSQLRSIAWTSYLHDTVNKRFVRIDHVYNEDLGKYIIPFWGWDCEIGI